MSKIRHLILDFDGTCTQIPLIQASFLDAYREAFAGAIAQEVTEEDWFKAQKIVRENSPREGWSLGTTPSAPVACDPYILADESAKLVCRQRGVIPPDGYGLHSSAYHQHSAPWRDEALEIICKVTELDVGITFVSNSSSKYVNGRLDELLRHHPNVRASVSVESDAGKFLIKELNWGGGVSVAPEWRSKFDSLPPVDTPPSLGADLFLRPIYVRRGSYFEAMCRALRSSECAFREALVCGDVWELDLCMPYHLGMHVHLIERAQPFSNYSYELIKIKDCGDMGGSSIDLSGVLERLK
jgi:hypothetical protein